MEIITWLMAFLYMIGGIFYGTVCPMEHVHQIQSVCVSDDCIPVYLFSEKCGGRRGSYNYPYGIFINRNVPINERQGVIKEELCHYYQAINGKWAIDENGSVDYILKMRNEIECGHTGYKK